MGIVGNVLFIISIFLFIINIFSIFKIKKINTETEQDNRKIDIENEKLKTETETLQKQRERELLNIQEVTNLKQINEDELKRQKESIGSSLAQYCESLEQDYNNRENEYEGNLSLLSNSYDEEQTRVLSLLDIQKKELKKLEDIRADVLKAQIRELEIKEKKSFYCLCPTASELKDITILNGVKDNLTKVRILDMLIWSTFFQKPMTQLCNKVLEGDEGPGIYKITNTSNDMCYIGQAVNIATRWKTHAKAGLGIDTPANNKLYIAMINEGIWNFSWEVLTRCESSDLNEQEKFFINLYKAYEYGYNSNRGNK